MGLPKFISGWLNAKSREDPRYKGINLSRVPRGTDALAIDMNGMIHDGIQAAWGVGKYKNDIIFNKMLRSRDHKRFDEMISSILKILLDAVVTVSPNKTLFIAVDGKAPLSKLKQQRDRRFRSAVSSDGTTPDTSFVTPGTDFMEALDVSIRSFIADKRSQLPPTVVFSGHRTPGEGEHKIMSLLRSLKKPYKNGVVVYGMDADLLMLCTISPQDKIYLMRESADNVLDIDRFKLALIDCASTELQPTCHKDFVALMFNIGNDFLPSGPLHNSIFDIVEGLMKSYYKVNRPLTIPDNSISIIDFEVLGLILNDFGNTEIRRASRELVKKDPRDNPNRFVDISLRSEMNTVSSKPRYYLDYEVMRSIWYTNEFMPAGQISDWGSIPIPDVNDIEDMCRKYLEGIAWSFRYYQTKTINTEWYYPYNHPPLKTDMARYLMQVKPEDVAYINKLTKQRTVYRYGILEQLLAVIHPNSAQNSLPSQIRHLAIDPRSPIFDLFHVGHIIEKDGVADQFAYTFRSIVAPINMDRIIRAVSITDLNAQNYRWMDQEQSITKSTKGEVESWNKRREAKHKLPTQKTKRNEMNEKGKIMREKSYHLASTNEPRKTPEKKIAYPTLIGGGRDELNIRGESNELTNSKFLRSILTSEYDVPLGFITKQPPLEEGKQKHYSYNPRGRGGRGGSSFNRESQSQSRSVQNVDTQQKHFQGRGRGKSNRGNFRGRGKTTPS